MMPMLRTFRKSATGFFAKLLLGLLIASFALWGVGDIFRGTPGNTVATVDGDAIIGNELLNAIYAMQQQYPELTSEQANSLPVMLQVLDRLINTRLLEKEAEAMGLQFSEATLTERIARDSMFHDAKGEFDRKRFTSLLAQNGWSQAAFLQRYARDLKLGLAESAITLGVQAPEALIDTYYHVRNEEREASLILIGNDDIGAVGTPDDKTLQAMYEAREESFRLPEFRTYRSVTFDAERVAELKSLTPTEDELRAYYEENEAEFQTFETRDTLQLLFDSAEQAQAAHQALEAARGDAATLSLDTVKDIAAKADGLMNADALVTQNLGKTDLTANVSEPVFALEANRYTQQLETEFGWQILYVDAINEAGIRPFDAVKESIASLLTAQRVEAELTAAGNLIDDALASGATLEEALKQAGLGKLKIVTLGPIAVDGMLKNREMFEMSAMEQEILRAAFDQPVGETSPIAVTQNGHYFVVEAIESIPSAVPPLESVKQTLIKDWKKEERRKKRLAKASEIADALQAAENPMIAVGERGLSLHRTGKIKRMHDTVSNQSQLKDKILTGAFVDAIFALRENEVSDPYALPSEEYAIAVLDAIHTAPEPDALARDLLRRELNEQIQSQVMNAFLANLRERYEVEIMMDALAEAATQSR